MLSGDRTLQEGSVNAECSANVGTTYLLYRSSPTGWKPGLHAAAGNLLLNDGHVEEFSASGLAWHLRSLDDQFGSGRDHFLKPD